MLDLFYFVLLTTPGLALSNQGFGTAKPVSSTKQRCLNGSMWKRDCNDCYCENGIPFCHALPCNLPRGFVRKPCESGSTWKIDCNFCVCTMGIPVCSRLICPSASNGVIRKERCVEGTMWKNGCNDCFCFSGLVACSVKPCNSPGEVGSKNNPALWKPTLMFEIGESPNTQCIPGTSWKSKCNICFCSYGIPACTMRDCSLNVQVFTEDLVMATSTDYKFTVDTTDASEAASSSFSSLNPEEFSSTLKQESYVRTTLNEVTKSASPSSEATQSPEMFQTTTIRQYCWV